MELSFRNYFKQEKELLNLIETSDYISFSLVKTGSDNDKNNSIIDTPKHRYSKYKKTSEKFTIIQLGLSFFKSTSNPNIYHKQISYDCHTYNLYLFQNAKDLKDIFQDELNLEVKSMNFNQRKNKIDFNAWINEGIQYLNEKQYRQLYKNIIENNINNDNFHIDISNLKQRDLDFANKNIDYIKNNYINNEKIFKTNFVINNMPKYILYYIKKNLPNNLYFQENNRFHNKSFCTLITGYKSPEEKEKLYKNDILTQLKELNHKKGVKKLIDAIFNKINFGDSDIEENDINKNNIPEKRKKNLIGHNMSLDLMFIISKLGDCLPSEYTSFKNMIKDKLNLIYDTKFLFEEFKNSELNKNNNVIKGIKSEIDEMYQYLHSNFSENIKIKLKPREDLLSKNNSFHNAGYDSLITGVCFLYMKNAIKNNKFLEENKNQMYLCNSLYKSINLNKEKDDYILNINNLEENSFVFKQTNNKNDINYEIIFGEKLWKDSVIETIFCETNNILIIFTKFLNNENKSKFLNIAFSHEHKNAFSVFSLVEFRSKYME